MVEFGRSPAVRSTMCITPVLTVCSLGSVTSKLCVKLSCAAQVVECHASVDRAGALLGDVGQIPLAGKILDDLGEYLLKLIGVRPFVVQTVGVVRQALQHGLVIVARIEAHRVQHDVESRYGSGS